MEITENDVLIERLEKASKEGPDKLWEIIINNKDRLILDISPYNTFISIKNTFTKVYMENVNLYLPAILPLFKAVGIEYNLINYTNEKI